MDEEADELAERVEQAFRRKPLSPGDRVVSKSPLSPSWAKGTVQDVLPNKNVRVYWDEPFVGLSSVVARDSLARLPKEEA